MRTRTNQNKENTFNDHEKLHTIQTSIKDISDNENSDSSLELYINKKPRYKNNYRQKLNNNVNLDCIDLTDESETKLKNLNFNHEKKNSLNASRIPSICSISSSSNESFKSISNSFSYLNSDHKDFENEYNKISPSIDNISTFENNCITPKEKHIKVLSESAKLLDRFYGNEWRKIDGVLSNTKEKKLSDKSIENDK